MILYLGLKLHFILLRHRSWLSVCSLQWRHNEPVGISNHRRLDRLLNRLFWRRSKKTSTLRVTGLCEGIHRWPVYSPHKGPVTPHNLTHNTFVCVLRTYTTVVAFLNICAHNYVNSAPNHLEFYRHIDFYIKSHRSTLFGQLCGYISRYVGCLEVMHVPEIWPHGDGSHPLLTNILRCQML